MKTALDSIAKQSKKPAAKKPAAKPLAVRRGSKRTEEFLAAVLGMKFR